MSLTFAQIVTLACQIAKAPGFTSQAGQMFNSILEELAQTYDFKTNEMFASFNFNPGLVPPAGSPVSAGSGPYPLPANFLRAEADDVFYTISGVPYVMKPLTMAEFDGTVQQPNQQTYPWAYAVDMSATPPALYCYPPPSGNYPVFLRYQSLPADTATPEPSGGPPWFPIPTYLYKRLALELMQISDDERVPLFRADCEDILRRYLSMKDNPETRANTVKLDPIRFGKSFSRLPNTKQIGW